MEVPFNKALIAKFLAQQCTEEEKKIVAQGLNTPEGRLLFDEVLLANWQNVSVDEISEQQMSAWQQELHQKMATAGRIKKTFRILSPAVIRYAGISAVLVMGVIIFATVKSKRNAAPQPIAMQEVVNPYGKRTLITLPDSSTVLLGAGSKLRFAETFPKDRRDITLEGEAFFDVKHKPNQSFIVHTGSLQTRDIGTTFKITAFKNHPVRIALASGKIRVEKISNKHIQVLADMLPGQESVWKNQKLITRTISVQDITGWKDGRLVFDATRLNELTSVLERWYNVKITFKNAAKERLSVTTTLTVENTPISAIMDALSVTEHFKYSLKDGNIIIQ